ncbi:hypothetical protein T06_9736 [Trichinella sp. T6]|nr:hypothetical protein T06_9736 [Trichinella sp. T6]
MFDKGICEKSSVKLTLVPFVTRKLEVLLQHSRFLKQIIQYSDITPGIHEGRVYNLKRTNMEDVGLPSGCQGSIHTNLDVDAILDCNSHADDCIPGNDIFSKMEKKTVLKRRAAEEMKTVPQITKKQAVHLPTWKLLVSFQPIKVLKRQSTGNLRRNFRDFR